MSLRKVLYGLEYVFDGLICDHIVTDVEHLPEGKFKLIVHVRKWHPSYWIGYIRCVWMRDKCGSAYYKGTYLEGH